MHACTFLPHQVRDLVCQTCEKSGERILTDHSAISGSVLAVKVSANLPPSLSLSLNLVAKSDRRALEIRSALWARH